MVNVAEAGKLLLRSLVDQNSLILRLVLGSLWSTSWSLLLVLLMLRHLGPGTWLHHKVILIRKVKLISTGKRHPDVAGTIVAQGGVVVVQVAVAVKPGPLVFRPPGSLGRLFLPSSDSRVLILTAGGVAVTCSLLWLLKMKR